MKVDHPHIFVSPKLSARSFAMPSRPMKRSRSKSGEGQADRPLKRVSLVPVNKSDIFLPRPIFHTVLPLVDFSQQKPPIVAADGYSMTPLWGPGLQSDSTTTPPKSPPSQENQADDGDRMDCDTATGQPVSPGVTPLSTNRLPHGPSGPSDTEAVQPRIPKPLMTCPSLEMSETLSPAPQDSAPQIVPSVQPKRPRFTMGPRSDCEKCRMGVKGHWGHFT
ncbi:hypothetical protein BJ322DRAFT_1033954 [Thelephora terrestris]|uniref:Uncharacterized protein n=1 Tax=Thelephora terrestris TaxID=56493 RepID=A0A9P6HSE7_9AGAM|nr:hypothetical protein BJ322DRAFT_1033954 [Thelephora terrestris]